VDDEHQRIGVTEPGWFQRREDHARDLDLINEYLQTHHRTAARLRAQTEQQRRRQLTSPGLPAS
jgi:hypothetical protein